MSFSVLGVTDEHRGELHIAWTSASADNETRRAVHRFYRASSYASAVLEVVILSVRLSVTRAVCDKPNNALSIFRYYTKGQSL